MHETVRGCGSSIALRPCRVSMQGRNLVAHKGLACGTVIEKVQLATNWGWLVIYRDRAALEAIDIPNEGANAIAPAVDSINGEDASEV